MLRFVSDPHPAPLQQRNLINDAHVGLSVGMRRRWRAVRLSEEGPAVLNKLSALLDVSSIKTKNVHTKSLQRSSFREAYRVKSFTIMVDAEGIEPSTCRLRVECSAS
jgi:hypothetical protein